MRKCGVGNTAKKTRKRKERVKKELRNSFIEEEKHKNKDLDEEVDKVEKCEDAAVVIREYEEIIRIKQKNIMYIV